MQLGFTSCNRRVVLFENVFPFYSTTAPGVQHATTLAGTAKLHSLLLWVVALFLFLSHFSEINSALNTLSTLCPDKECKKPHTHRTKQDPYRSNFYFEFGCLGEERFCLMFPTPINHA